MADSTTGKTKQKLFCKFFFKFLVLVSAVIDITVAF
jgi:hypothetical protein